MEHQKTYRELKEFVNSLSEEQLNQKVSIDRSDEKSMALTDFSIADEDLFIYDDDWEDFGTKEILKDCHEEDGFDENELTLVFPKGTVFIGAEYFPKKEKV